MLGSSNSDLNAIYLGKTSPVDMKEYNVDWQSLTIDDFYIGSISAVAQMHTAYPASEHGCTMAIDAQISKAYDNSTGILTFSGLSGSWNSAKGDYLRCFSSNTFAILIP